MGLGLSHNAGDFSYAGFSIWRTALAKAGGYELVETDRGLRPDIDFSQFNTDNDLRGFWYEDPQDPLMYLIWHSDCEGGISPYQLSRLIPRLKDIRDSGRVKFVDGWGDLYDKLDVFIAGCEDALSKNETIEFW